MAEINIDETKTRNYILGQYMLGTLDTLYIGKIKQINANFLSPEVNNYSLDRLPVQPIAGNWIIPTKKFREVYELRSRNTYGMEMAENLKNVGFFEALEEKIYSNNKEGVLPEIEGIESIQCLNCGSLNIANTQDCIFSVQIQIEYLKEIKMTTTSL